MASQAQRWVDRLRETVLCPVCGEPWVRTNGHAVRDVFTCPQHRRQGGRAKKWKRLTEDALGDVIDERIARAQAVARRAAESSAKPPAWTSRPGTETVTDAAGTEFEVVWPHPDHDEGVKGRLLPAHPSRGWSAQGFVAVGVDGIWPARPTATRKAGRGTASAPSSAKLT